MFFFDPTYLLFMLPALALSAWASFRTKSAFDKYSKVRSGTGYTGAQAARSGYVSAVAFERAQFLNSNRPPTTNEWCIIACVIAAAVVAAVECEAALSRLMHRRRKQSIT